jgi:hypothetical protein
MCTYFNYVSSSLKKNAGQFFVALNFKIAFDCIFHYKRKNINELTLCNKQSTQEEIIFLYYQICMYSSIDYTECQYANTWGVQVLRSPILFSGLGADRHMWFSLKYMCTLCECVIEMAALYSTQNSSGGGNSEECF